VVQNFDHIESNEELLEEASPGFQFSDYNQ